MMRVLVAAVLGLGLAAGAAVASVEDQIRARIAPVGSVCIAGEACEGVVTSAAPAAAAASGPRSGQDVYNAACMACHAAGVAGAPVTGNAGQWESRLDKGLETLVANAIGGIGAMPAKGGCASCSDEEIEKSVQYMLDQL
ncbi:MAG: c-type cytochrome [Marinobacter sp.]|nr:c-type cytochrome [Marinobacter sp.]